jgi:uncharacterized heparinase superfamily protein
LSGGRAAAGARALLYLRTASQLRWEQWYYRAARRVQGRFLAAPPPAPLGESEERWARLAEAVAGWGPEDAEARVRRAERVMAGEFRFLNHSERLPRVDWRRRHVSHLWSYNLHYFDYALDLAWSYRLRGERRYADRFAELATGWVDAMPAGRGDGWEPYAVSLRAVNWMYALLLLGDALDAPTRRRLLASLAAQLGFLERRLELHILGNHLLKNLKALVLAGSLFDGAAAARWRTRLARRLWREVREQVLPDGVHFERSPMYHAITLADLLELLACRGAAGDRVPAEVEERVGRMVDAFAALSRPDGTLHLLNDSAHGIAPGRAWLGALARATLGRDLPDLQGAIDLPAAGYFGWVDDAAGERFVVDCGEPGPSYQPGHAHCDLLGFELDLGGRPVVVDSGVCGYEGDELREYVRSTRAHSTVSVAGREQSELWGTFRVARRARPRRARQEVDGGAYRFEGAYSPYHDPAIVHSRVVERTAGGWTVRDRVEGARGERVTGFLHFHPDFQLADESGCLVDGAGLRVRVEARGADRLRWLRGERGPAQGWYCPEFGLPRPALALEMEIDAYDGREFGYTLRTLSARP